MCLPFLMSDQERQGGPPAETASTTSAEAVEKQLHQRLWGDPEAHVHVGLAAEQSPEIRHRLAGGRLSFCLYRHIQSLSLEQLGGDRVAHSRYVIVVVPWARPILGPSAGEFGHPFLCLRMKSTYLGKED